MVDTEQIEHIIQVDESITVNMKIPKVISVLEFKAITAKISKLFNITTAANAAAEFNSIATAPRQYTKRAPRQDYASKKEIFTDIIYERFANNKSAKEIAEIINGKHNLRLNAKTIERRIWYIKEKRQDIIDIVKEKMKGI